MSAQKSLPFRTVFYFVVGMNCCALIFFFPYLYFLMRERFEFHDKSNLALATLLGCIYTLASWQGGRFAQRRGYFTALKTGQIILIVSLAVGSLLHTATGVILAACVAVIGQCLTYPSLEAIAGDGETAAGLPRAIGIYNVVWATMSALAFLFGGTIIEKFGFQNLFYVPIAIQCVQLPLTIWLQNHATATAAAAPPLPVLPPDPHRPSPRKAKTFLYMAWLANPFAYIAITTLIAVLPGIAAKFHLTPMFAGFAGSLWYFARLGAFVLLWHWTDWHCRFRWLVMAFTLLILSFASVLMAPHLAILLAAQIFFGLAVGLIYYSSLFYSMDAGEAKGEHGGIHEATIGCGNCLGPAVGALSLQWVPQCANSAAIAVSVLLICGFGGLLAIRKFIR